MISRSSRNKVQPLGVTGDSVHAVLNTASRNHIAAAVWDRAESAVDAGIGQHIKDKLDAIIADTEDIQDWESSYVEISDTEIVFKRTDGTSTERWPRSIPSIGATRGHHVRGWEATNRHDP